jgi:hypothetical protein
MQKENLGQILANLLKEEADGSLAAAKKAAEATSAEALKDFNEVQDFFDKYQQTVVDCLSHRKPAKSLEVVVGTTGRSTSANEDIYLLLKLYSGNQMSEPPQVTKKGNTYYPIWESFLDWATAAGLRPVWRYQHDGVGVHGWYVLTVVPLP